MEAAKQDVESEPMKDRSKPKKLFQTKASLHQNHSVSKSQLLPLARLGIEIYSFGSLLNLFPLLQDQVQVLHKVLTKGTL